MKYVILNANDKSPFYFMVIKPSETKITLVFKIRERRLKLLDDLKKERRVEKFGNHRTY